MVAFAVASQAPSQPAQVASVGRFLPASISVSVPIESVGEEPASITQPAIQLVAETPTSPKLNPMGMEKRPNDTLESAAAPVPMITPVPAVTAPVPVVGPPTRSAADRIAEGPPNDPNPMGDPHIGMTSS